MDKTEKIALARKKLRKFQAKSSSPLLDTSREYSNGIHDYSPKVTRTDDDSLPTLPSQAHSQSLDILVAEKANLVHRLTQTETELRQKQQECFAYQNEVSSLQRQLEENDKGRRQINRELERKNEILSQSFMSDKELRENLQSARKTIEDTMEENKELLNRITTQSKELHTLTQTNKDLENKLTMKDILIQQLQSSSQPNTPTNSKGHDKVDELEAEVSRLMAGIESMKRERDQAMSDVAALREALLATQQDNARKVGQLQTQVKESEIEISSLNHQISSSSSNSDLKNKEVQSLQLALDAVHTERDELSTRVQQMVSDNARLSQLYSTAEDSVCQLEAELSRVKGEVIDQQGLMATISQDKESISRAVAQNKELKEQLTELQEAFIQKSHQNMGLASSLQTEKYQVQKLNERTQELERELRLAEEQLEQVGADERKRERTPPKNEVQHLTGERIHTNQDTSPIMNKAADVSQLQELSMECTSLREERDKLLEELRKLTSPSPPHSIMDQEDDDYHRSPGSTSIDQGGDVSLLQQSFSALQERFTYVMKDKADLLDRLQVLEHTIVQLSGENETIAEYVTLYQTQREALKVKFTEKDRIIEQLQQDKNNLQLKLREVQLMLSRLDHTPSEPQQQYHDHHHLANRPSLPAHMSTEKGVVGQIVSLIEDELTFPSSSNLSTTSQCPCCSGQLIVI